MNIYAFGPIAAILDGAYTVVTTLTGILQPVAGTSSAAIAIVLLTVLVRAALIPVGVAQVRAEAVRRRLAPQLAELQRRYKREPELLRRKTVELYAGENASPLAGCLPLLLQAPVLFAVYGLFILPTVSAHPNALLSSSLFGVPLGTGLPGVVASGALTPSASLLFGILIGLIAAVAYASRKLLPFPGGSSGNETNAALVGVLSLMPFSTAVAAAFVPLAAAIYLLVTVTWTLAERLTLRRLLRITDPPAQ